MSRPRVDIRMPPRSAFDNFERETKERIKAAALNATHIAAGRAKRMIRDEMVAADLGRLGKAIDSGSDLEKRGVVKNRGHGFSASGWVYVRSNSERTRGTIESYTVGAEIAPRNGRYLWIATDQIPTRAGRYKMTPALYNRMGFDAKIGPLVPVRSQNGTMMLIVRNVGVNAAGKPNSAKSLTKRGMPRKGQIGADFIVAFYAIDRTSRRGRIDVPGIMREAQASLPELLEQQLNRR